MLQRRFAWFILLVTILAACNAGSQGGIPAPTAIPANLRLIKFAYDSAAQGWMQKAIDGFNQSAQKDDSGKQLAVSGQPIGSGAMVEAMVQGDSPYDLIMPADKTWVDILTERRKLRGEKALSVGTCAVVARSPVVMITWHSMAEALGWPDREFTWHDIADLALSPSAWQNYDHPDWGTLTFGHAHPILSGGGLAATLGEAYAAGPLTLADVQSDVVKSYLRVVERSIARYGSDTSSLIRSMAEKGQRYLHIAIGYESDVVANQRGTDPLVAIYPKETFVAEYAACVLNNLPNSSGAAQFVQYLRGDAGQQAALDAGIRPLSGKLGAPIDTAHNVDPDAKFQPIPMPGTDVIRAVQDTWSQLKRPLNVTMVIDVSGSMNTGGKIAALRTGATAFINRLDNEDTVTIYSFSTSINVLISQASIGQNRSRLLSIIDGLKADGETALYDAVWQARQQMKINSKQINAIVVLTDGADTASRSIRVNDLISGLRSAKGSVTVYTIGYGSDADNTTLARIADAGNGMNFSGDPATINQIYLEIASQFGGSQGLGR